MTTTTSSPQTATTSLYEVIEEHSIQIGGRLPSVDELEQVRGALHAVQEFLTGQIAEGVIGVGNAAKAHSITYEDIGRLVVWADQIRDLASYIIDDAAKVAIVAHDAFDLANGFEGGGTMFSRYGSVEDERSFQSKKRAFEMGGS
jgi:hypothetical protein